MVEYYWDKLAKYQKESKIKPGMMGPPGRAGFNTGAGFDNVVQPDMPVAYDYSTNPPTVIHEGEDVEDLGNGNKRVVPANKSSGMMASMLTPSSQEQQMHMKRAEKAMSLPGMQGGGDIIAEDKQMAPLPIPAPELVKDKPVTTLGSNIEPYSAAKQESLQRTAQVTRGEDPLMKNVANRAMQDIERKGQLQRSVIGQTVAADAGLTEGAKRASVLGLESDIASQRAEAAGALAEKTQQRQYDAIQDMAKLGREGEQDIVVANQWAEMFADEQARYKDSQGWTAYEKAVEANDYNTAAAKYAELTGAELSTDQFEYMKTWQNKMTEANVGAAILSNDISKSAFFGYEDPSTGEWVMGSGQIAAERFGLAGKTFDMQYDEMYGYTDKDGIYVPGKYEQMGNADRRAADALYGFDVPNPDGTTSRVKGTLALEGDRVAIEQQGLSLTEAQLKGWTETLDDGTEIRHKGTIELNEAAHDLDVDADQRAHDLMYGWTDAKGNEYAGTLEIAAGNYDLNVANYDLMYEELHGFDILDADGNVTGHIAGSMENMDTQTQNEIKSLFGWDEQAANGEIIHHSGTLELQRDQVAISQQGMDLDEAQLKGYYNETGDWVMGSIDTARETFNAVYGEGGYEDRKITMAEDTTESAAYWEGSDRFKDFVLGHVDMDATSFTDDFYKEAAKWYKAKYGEEPVSTTDAAFRNWATEEFNAANDDRLTNPLTATLYNYSSAKDPDGNPLYDSEELATLTEFFKTEAYGGYDVQPVKDDDGNIIGVTAVDPSTGQTQTITTKTTEEVKETATATPTGEAFTVGGATYISTGNGESKAVTFDSDVDFAKAWSNDYNAAIVNDSNSYLSQQIIAARMDDIAAGEYELKDLVIPRSDKYSTPDVNNSLYQAALDVAIEEGNPSNGDSDTGMNTRVYAPWHDLPNGSIVKYNGTLYVLKNHTNVTRTGRDETDYYLENPFGAAPGSPAGGDIGTKKLVIRAKR